MSEPAGVWEVPASWRTIDFISDLHLAEDTPRTFAAWSTYLLGTPADAVLILGDLFESWVGDDARFDPFEASGVAALREAASRRTIAFMVGNRDFLVGPEMLAACGMSALADPSVVAAFGQCALLAHGDAMCVDDTAYQAFRTVVREAGWQREFLGRSLTERRAVARAMRTGSEAAKAAAGLVSDVDRGLAVAALNQAGATTLVHGHTHRPADEQLAPGLTRRVLSDWDLDHGRARAEVLRWSHRGFERLTPEAAVHRDA